MDTKNIKPVPENEEKKNKQGNIGQKKDIERKNGGKQEQRGNVATAVKPSNDIEENEEADTKEECGGKNQECSH